MLCYMRNRTCIIYHHGNTGYMTCHSIHARIGGGEMKRIANIIYFGTQVTVKVLKEGEAVDQRNLGVWGQLQRKEIHNYETHHEF